MINSKEEYVKTLAKLAENGELFESLCEGKIDGIAIDKYDKDFDILLQLLEYEDFNQSFEVLD